MEDLHISLRALLGPNHGPDPNNQPSQSDHGGESITQDLRIAAVFIILAAGLIGGAPPLFIKAFRQRGHPVQRIIRALSAGVILSLALVHIIPEAVIELGELGQYMGDHPYNVAGCVVMFGILLMLALENLAQVLLTRRAARIAAEAAGAKTAHDTETAAAAASATNPVGSLMGDPHTHVCIGHTNPLVLDGIVPDGTVRDQVMAIMFELGCVFHSFIIGLSVGVQTDDLTEVRALTIALAFHQALEAVALGSFLVKSGVGTWKGLVLVGIYAATCPVGVAIGIGVAETYDPGSIKAIATQGVFNGLSGGMLLYVALIQLLAEDFSRREVHDHGHSAPAASGGSTPRATAHAKVAEHAHKHAHEHTSGHTHAHDHAHGHTHAHEHTHDHLHAHEHTNGHSHAHTSAHGASTDDKAWVTPASYAALLLGAAAMATLGVWA